MSNTTHRRANHVFAEALEYTEASRIRFLQAECAGKGDLRREVDAMLEADGEDDRFLCPFSGNIKSQFGDQLKERDPLIDTQVGAYTIRKRIGQGGMGVVYLATRSLEYRQRVAIKVLKRGTDTEAVLQRFQMEIRVLATLSKHPHIAGLLDAGTTDLGLPYFVMQFVEGERIDEYCQRNRLSLEERLELFIKVCSAVHFAHSHGVIHRDIKPGNILVGNDGNPQLIDFGIAKLTSPELAVESVAPTCTDSRPMTPRYASPEQFRGDALTTRSDVYALGTVLYELLTGKTPYPFEGESRERWEWAVREQEPTRPSATVARPRERKTSRSPNSHRDSELRIRRKLKGDLDNIILMALRKEPHRRYASVDDLAKDIQRYLHREVVEARPIHGIERVWRWCQTHRVASMLFAVLLLCSLLGVWHLVWLSNQIARSAAMESAAQKVELIKSVHEHYSQVTKEFELMEPVAAKRMKAPATFTIELGDYLEESESGVQFRLFSKAPFRTRRSGGPKDEFERNALLQAEQHPDKAIHSFESYAGRPSLRYAIPRIMKQSCVDCHNSHPDRPLDKTWKVGDVRGVLEVIQPLDTTAVAAQSGLNMSYQLIIGTFVVSAVACLVVPLLKRRSDASP